MKILDGLVQGSAEWLDFRRSHIGASDAATCMGLNPWRTTKQLWEEKVLGWSQELNDNMRRGQQMEELARVEYQLVTNRFVIPMVGEDIVHPFISASFDGITPDYKHAVEIKCGKGSHKLALKGEVPIYYNAQMQHQMYVADLEMIDYFSFDGTEGILIQVERDNQFIEEMLAKEVAFWNTVTRLTAPED